MEHWDEKDIERKPTPALLEVSGKILASVFQKEIYNGILNEDDCKKCVEAAALLFRTARKVVNEKSCVK